MREAKESTKPEKRLHEARDQTIEVSSSVWERREREKIEGVYVTRPQDTMSKHMKIEGVNFFMRTVAGISAATSAERRERDGGG